MGYHHNQQGLCVDCYESPLGRIDACNLIYYSVYTPMEDKLKLILHQYIMFQMRLLHNFSFSCLFLDLHSKIARRFIMRRWQRPLMSTHDQRCMIFITLDYSSKANNATYNVCDLFWVCACIYFIYINVGCASIWLLMQGVNYVNIQPSMPCQKHNDLATHILEI